MDGTTNRVRAALAELPGLPLRVEESMKDGYGAVADSGELPSFLFRNCGDAEAEAIVEILNGAPALLDELDRLQGAVNELSGGRESGSLATVEESDSLPAVLTDLNRLMKDASSLIRERGWLHSSWRMQPKSSDPDSPESKSGPVTFFDAISECALDQVEYGLAIIFLDADGENGGWLADEELTRAKVLRRLRRAAKPASMVKCMGPDWEEIVRIAKTCLHLSDAQKESLADAGKQKYVGENAGAYAAAYYAAAGELGWAFLELPSLLGRHRTSEAVDAMRALLVRHRIGQGASGFTREHYEALTRGWAQISGKVHPHD